MGDYLMFSTIEFKKYLYLNMYGQFFFYNEASIEIHH